MTKVAIFRYNNASCPKTTDFSQGKDDHKQKKMVIRSLKKEGYCQNDIDHLFNVIVLTKVTFYGLSAYAASKSELTTVQKFVCLCYKRKYKIGRAHV